MYIYKPHSSKISFWPPFYVGCIFEVTCYWVRGSNQKWEREIAEGQKIVRSGVERIGLSPNAFIRNSTWPRAMCVCVCVWVCVLCVRGGYVCMRVYMCVCVCVCVCVCIYVCSNSYPATACCPSSLPITKRKTRVTCHDCSSISARNARHKALIRSEIFRHTSHHLRRPPPSCETSCVIYMCVTYQFRRYPDDPSVPGLGQILGKSCADK